MASGYFIAEKKFVARGLPKDLNDPNVLINPDTSAVDGYDTKYWVVIDDQIALMTQADRDAVDAAEGAAAVERARVVAESTVDDSTNPTTVITEGVGALVQIEFQALKAAVQQIADEIGVVLDPPLRPSPTMDELRTALKGLVRNG